MRIALYFSLFLSSLPAVAGKAYERLPEIKMIPGSIATIIPNRGLEKKKPEERVVEDRLIPEGHLRSMENTHQERMRRTDQYLHYDAKEQMSNKDAVVFGFREDRNTKKINIRVDLPSQKAYLTSTDPNIPPRVMPVSTGMAGHLTERHAGCYEIKRTEKIHYSREYNNAPMPNASAIIDSRGIYFHQGDLGSRSHGCIRMSPGDSLYLMKLFENNKKDIGAGKKKFDARICIEAAPPKQPRPPTPKPDAPAVATAKPRAPAPAAPAVATSRPSAATPKPAAARPAPATQTWYDRLFELQRIQAAQSAR